MEQLSMSYEDVSPSSANVVSTTRGLVRVGALGLTLIHEHVFNLYHSSQRESVVAFTLAEHRRLREAGVSTIVDLTPYARLGAYQEVIERSPLVLVCCAGFHSYRHLPANVRVAEVPELRSRLLRQVKAGIGLGHYHPGCLKVAGSHVEPIALEKRLFEAVALVQRETDLPVVTHSPVAQLEHLRLLESHGVDPRRVLVSHVDIGLTKGNFKEREQVVLRLLGSGANVLFTQFGSTCPTKPGQPGDLTLSLANGARERGHIGQVFVSSDSSWSWRRGGPRFRTDAPGRSRRHDYALSQGMRVLRNVGFTEDDIGRIFLSNPGGLLGIEGVIA